MRQSWGKLEGEILSHSPNTRTHNLCSICNSRLRIKGAVAGNINDLEVEGTSSVRKRAAREIDDKSEDVKGN